MESRWPEPDYSGDSSGGWFSYAALTGDAGGGEPLDDAYTSFTNPERFLPLHDWALEAVALLQREYEVVREEGEGMDALLERVPLARPTIRLTPQQDDGAPITIAFTASPGLEVRAGRWFTDGFPSCHCDACDEQPEDEFERFTELLDDVVAGRFREAMHRQTEGTGWSSHEFWSGENRRSGGSLVSRSETSRTLGGEAEITVEWLPWQARSDAASNPKRRRALPAPHRVCQPVKRAGCRTLRLNRIHRPGSVPLDAPDLRLRVALFRLLQHRAVAPLVHHVVDRDSAPAVLASGVGILDLSAPGHPPADPHGAAAGLVSARPRPAGALDHHALAVVLLPGYYLEIHRRHQFVRRGPELDFAHFFTMPGSRS